MTNALPKHVSDRFLPSPELARSAGLFVRLAAEQEAADDGSGRQRPYVTASILLSMAYLEASINEVIAESSLEASLLFLTLTPERRSRIASLESLALTRKAQFSAMDKANLVLIATGLEPVPTGISPGQDVLLLAQLRNELVHGEPSWVPLLAVEVENGAIVQKPVPAAERHKLEKRLTGRFELAPGRFGRPFLPDQCLSAGCAAWSLQVASAFVREFFAKLGVPPLLPPPA
jgi:hypothetical protein